MQPTSWFRLAALVAWSLLTPLPAPAAGPVVTQHDGVRMTVITKYYPVAGKSAEDLRREMDRIGPMDHGERFDARTDWYIKWRYLYGNESDRCTIASVTVELDVNFTYPQFVATAGASRELQQLWDRYLAALRHHEEGHQQLALEAAQAIRTAIERLPPMDSCDALGVRANRVGDELLARGNRANADYDRTTDHGATQGARFP